MNEEDEGSIWLGILVILVGGLITALVVGLAVLLAG